MADMEAAEHHFSMETLTKGLETNHADQVNLTVIYRAFNATTAKYASFSGPQGEDAEKLESWRTVGRK